MNSIFSLLLIFLAQPFMPRHTAQARLLKAHARDRLKGLFRANEVN